MVYPVMYKQTQILTNPMAPSLVYIKNQTTNEDHIVEAPIMP